MRRTRLCSWTSRSLPALSTSLSHLEFSKVLQAVIQLFATDSRLLVDTKRSVSTVR